MVGVLSLSLRDQIIEEIARLGAELKAARAMLEAHDRHAPPHRYPDGTKDRFFGVRPQIAFFDLLREKGSPMSVAELTQRYVDGGGTRGKKRDEKQPNNVRISLEKLLKNGVLQQRDGLIGLPEWDDDKYVSS